MMNSLRNFFCVPSCQTANKGDCLYTCNPFVYFKISSFPILMHLWFQNGILKGEVSLYCWPTVWLVWNQLYDYWQFWFLFAKQTNPNQSNRRSMVQWYSPFSIPWSESLLNIAYLAMNISWLPSLLGGGGSLSAILTSMLKSGNTNWSGTLSTVDLLI